MCETFKVPKQNRKIYIFGRHPPTWNKIFLVSHFSFGDYIYRGWMGFRHKLICVNFSITFWNQQELGSISARVLINQSVRACDLGKLLLLGVSGTILLYHLLLTFPWLGFAGNQKICSLLRLCQERNYSDQSALSHYTRRSIFCF